MPFTNTDLQCDTKKINAYYFSAGVLAAAKQSNKQVPESLIGIQPKELRAAVRYLEMCNILSLAAMESDPASVLSVNRVMVSNELIEAGVFDGLVRPIDVPYIINDNNMATDLTDALSISAMVCGSSDDRDEDSRQARAIIFFSVINARRSSKPAPYPLKPHIDSDVAKELEFDPVSILF